MKCVRKMFFLCFFLLGGASALFAQREKIRFYTDSDYKKFFWGIQVSASTLGFSVAPSQDNSLTQDEEHRVSNKDGLGFGAAAIAGYNINRFLSVRTEPGVIISSSTLTWNDASLIEAGQDARQLKNYYISVPFVLKFNSVRINNVRPYLTGGGGMLYNLGAKGESGADNAEGTFRLKPISFYWEVGFGVDFYTEFFKVSPALKYIRGFNDVLVRDYSPESPWTNPIKSMTPRGVFLTLTFE